MKTTQWFLLLTLFSQTLYAQERAFFTINELQQIIACPTPECFRDVVRKKGYEYHNKEVVSEGKLTLYIYRILDRSTQPAYPQHLVTYSVHTTGTRTIGFLTKSSSFPAWLDAEIEQVGFRLNGSDNSNEERRYVRREGNSVFQLTRSKPEYSPSTGGNKYSIQFYVYEKPNTEPASSVAARPTQPAVPAQPMIKEQSAPDVFSQNPSDVSPSAKILDADKLYPFNDGFAVVSKGRADALLKPDGSLLVPFNKYIFDQVSVLVPDRKGNYFDFPDKGFINGYAVARPVENAGKTFPSTFINLQGKESFSPTILANEPFVNGKSEVHISGKLHGYFLLNNGKMIPQRTLSSGLAAGLPDTKINYSNWKQADIFKYSCEQGKYGFVDINGKLIINCQYDAVGDFSEGIVKVMKIDEFGKPKWGFINSVGKQITGFIFSQEPRDFHCGLAAVFPKNGSEFSYSYIDRSGQVKIKSSVKGSWEVNNRGHDTEWWIDFMSGYARWSDSATKIFVDTLGNLHDLRKLRGSFTYKGKTYNELNDNSFFFDNFDLFQNGMIEFSWSGLHGLADANGNIVVPPVFNKITPFDPVSKLAYAEVRGNNGKLTEGYINQKGVFVILKGNGSKW